MKVMGNYYGEALEMINEFVVIGSVAPPPSSSSSSPSSSLEEVLINVEYLNSALYSQLGYATMTSSPHHHHNDIII